MHPFPFIEAQLATCVQLILLGGAVGTDHVEGGKEPSKFSERKVVVAAVAFGTARATITRTAADSPAMVRVGTGLAMPATPNGGFQPIR
jgi:hypothetical protein